MKHALQQLVDLVDILNMEPSEHEVSIDFFDRAIQSGLERGLLRDVEADEMVAQLEELIE